LTTLPPPRADCLEILGATTTWSPNGLSRPVMGWVNVLLNETGPGKICSGLTL
jgi:hypothetical protein